VTAKVIARKKPTAIKSIRNRVARKPVQAIPQSAEKPAEDMPPVSQVAPATIVPRVVRPSQASPVDDIASDTDDDALTSYDPLRQNKDTSSYD
jgi:hypothetical protein